jgi:hypothetical protein
MKSEKSKFDSAILFTVILIGFIFIAIASLSVAKNNGLYQQSTASNFTALKTKSFNVPVNGICGAANSKVFEKSPTGELCSTGNPSVIILENKEVGTFYNWQCIGINGGITASCSATANINSSSKKIDASCGSSNNQEINKMPAVQEEYCNTGSYVKGDCEIPIYDSVSKKWKSTCSWLCSGGNGGTSEKCSAMLVK